MYEPICESGHERDARASGVEDVETILISHRVSSEKFAPVEF